MDQPPPAPVCVLCSPAWHRCCFPKRAFFVARKPTYVLPAYDPIFLQPLPKPHYRSLGVPPLPKGVRLPPSGMDQPPHAATLCTCFAAALPSVLPFRPQAHLHHLHCPSASTRAAIIAIVCVTLAMLASLTKNSTRLTPAVSPPPNTNPWPPSPFPYCTEPGVAQRLPRRHAHALACV